MTLKRRANEPLIPLRNSKYLRLDSHSSESKKLRDRWSETSQEVKKLVVDSIRVLFEAVNPMSSSLQSTSRQSTPRPTPLNDPPPIPASPSLLNRRYTPPTESESGSPRKLPIPEDPPPASPAEVSTPKDIPPAPPGVLVQNMSTLRLDGASMRSSQTSDSNLGSSSSQGSKIPIPSRRRTPRRREHIFAKVHKAQVRRKHQESREEMVAELYRLKQGAGYTSGISDFKGLLDYERQLQSIDLEHAPLPHPSSPFGARKPQPIILEPEDEFLRRALDKAKATLSSPRPPKTFSPTLEQIQKRRRAQDDALEQRIRPTAKALPSSLPQKDDEDVSRFLRTPGVVSKFAREQVADQDISRLRPGQWLNDEIINFYGAMILARAEGSKENPSSAKSKKTPLKAHYFSSFFWAKLTKEGYDKGRLAKWTKKVDIFSKDTILIPVNHSNAHWTAAAINFRQKRFESYDSMGMAKSVVFKALRSYVNDEHINKKKKPFDFTGWVDWAPVSTPQQENGFDCGVFTCHFLEALSRGVEIFNFTQKDMPYLRRRMIWEIGKAEFYDEH